MKTTDLIVTMGICVVLVGIGSGQPIATDEFILGAFHSSHQDDGPYVGFNQAVGYYQDSYLHYQELRNLHFNMLNDWYWPQNFNEAYNQGLWLVGTEIWPPSATYEGIQKLGFWAEAGKYFASTQGWNDYSCFANGTGLSGNNHQVTDIPGYTGQSTWVRYAWESVGHQPGIIINNLNNGYDRFLSNGQIYNDWYMRFYGRLNEEPTGNPVVLNVTVTWENLNQSSYIASWEGSGQVGLFSANDFPHNPINEWGVTPAKIFHTVDPGWPFYNGNIQVSWTGACDLEIFYVVVSNQLGDDYIYVQPGYWENKIHDAIDAYDSYPALPRFMIDDEPLWGDVWANDPLDQEIGDYAGNQVPYTLGISLNRMGGNYLMNIWQDLIDNDPEIVTYKYPILGDFYYWLPTTYSPPQPPGDYVPNPYPFGNTTFEEYDRAMNELDNMGLKMLINSLTGEVQEARTRNVPPGTVKPFWFIPQVGGWYSDDLLGSTGLWTWRTRHTTPMEFRGMVYLAIACGARGIMPYLFLSKEESGEYQIGVMGPHWTHDRDWYELETGQGDVYVGWLSSYPEIESMNRKLATMGPMLMKLQYEGQGSSYITAINDQAGQLAANHYFLSSLDQDGLNDPDPQAEYLTLVNRNCWPYAPEGAVRYFDIFTSLSGIWILEDLATHEFFAAAANGDFHWV